MAYPDGAGAAELVADDDDELAPDALHPASAMASTVAIAETATPRARRRIDMTTTLGASPPAEGQHVVSVR